MKFQIRFFVAILLIASCSVNPFNSYSKKTLKLTDEIIYSPYAMQKISINDQPEDLMLLNQVDQNYFKWSHDDLRLISKNGKIVKTYGLDNDFELNYYRGFSNLEMSVGLIRFKNPESDFLEIYFSYKVIENGLMQKIIDKSSFTYTLIEESFDVPKIKWSGRNLYWIDEEGYIWKSRQTLNPYGDRINIETLKKYSD
jgi:hypothetical protein